MSDCSIYLQGVPAGVSEKLLADFFKTYGNVVESGIMTGGKIAFVRFGSKEEAEKVLKDSANIAIGGMKVKVQAEKPSGGEVAPGVSLAKAEDLATVDVCVLRGARTKAALALARYLAKAKASVVCIWDRRSQEENLKAELTTQEYHYRSSLAAETRDKQALAAAEEACAFYAAPKVAVVHFVSDKMGVASSAFPDGPLNHQKELLTLAAGNHLETQGTLKAGTVYAEWLHRNHGALFVVFPEFAERWSQDVALSTSACHRAAVAGMVSGPRQLLSLQPTVGLQLLSGVAADVSAETICKTVGSTLSMPPEDMVKLDYMTIGIAAH